MKFFIRQTKRATCFLALAIPEKTQKTRPLKSSNLGVQSAMPYLTISSSPYNKVRLSATASLPKIKEKVPGMPYLSIETNIRELP